MIKGFWYNLNKKGFDSENMRVLRELLEYNPNAGYLDLGCGDGEVTMECAKKIDTTQIYGVDLMDKKLEEASKMGITVFNHSVDTELPFPNNYFEVVTANQVIEHLGDTDMFIKEIYRVLKPNGYAIISTNNLASAHWIIMFALGIQPPGIYESDEMRALEFGEYAGERLHYRMFMLSGLTRVLRFYGFKIEKTVGSYWFPLPVVLGRILCKIDKNHAACITVKVRK